VFSIAVSSEMYRPTSYRPGRAAGARGAAPCGHSLGEGVNAEEVEHVRWNQKQRLDRAGVESRAELGVAADPWRQRWRCAGTGFNRTTLVPSGRRSIMSLSADFQWPPPPGANWNRSRCSCSTTLGVSRMSSGGYESCSGPRGNPRSPARNDSLAWCGARRVPGCAPAARLTPSMRFDDSVLWMTAFSRSASRTWGDCCLKRACLPRYSPTRWTLWSSPWLMGCRLSTPFANDFASIGSYPLFVIQLMSRDQIRG